LSLSAIERRRRKKERKKRAAKNLSEKIAML
jgi:hypothetical protein